MKIVAIQGVRLRVCSRYVLSAHTCYQAEGIGQGYEQSFKVLWANTASREQRQQAHSAQAAEYSIEENVAASSRQPSYNP